MTASNRVLIFHLLIVNVGLVQEKEILVLLRLQEVFGWCSSSATFLVLFQLLFILFLALLNDSVLKFDFTNLLSVALNFCLLEVGGSDDVRGLKSRRRMSDATLDVFES